MDQSRRSSTAEIAAFIEMVDKMPDHHLETLAIHPKVLILAARYGDGHLRAAKAVALELLQTDPEPSLGVLDYYRFVNPRLDNGIRWAYLSSVRFAPSLWRWFYTSTQKIDPSSKAQKILNHIGLNRFYQAIKDNPPEVIVSTYPTAAGVVSALKRQGRLSTANFVVMTDYSVHSQWIHPGIDRYFVGSDDMKMALIARGLDEQSIVVSGIPVDERFRWPVDEYRVRQDLLLDDAPVVLFMGGAYMPQNEFETVLEAIDCVPVTHATIVIAGRAGQRRAIAEAYKSRAKNRLVVLDYVDNVHELMAISSMLVSKAGGLTTTESLCRGLPVVIYRPIPGQEDANADFLQRHGAGIRAHHEAEVGEIVGQLLANPWQLKAMARQARQLGHPDAAETVARHVLAARLERRANAPA
ncbi:MAG: glycosyltransferase [Firmicutes bacterium]|jgi:processive 1,2-diacylglycerol beta-glucosyltransferase|nr:glycosyltransferase [Bacillota bacterium]